MFSVLIASHWTKPVSIPLKLLWCAPMTFRSAGGHLFFPPVTALENICLMMYHAVFCFRHDLAPSDSIMEAASVYDSLDVDNFNTLDFDV